MKSTMDQDATNQSALPVSQDRPCRVVAAHAHKAIPRSTTVLDVKQYPTASLPNTSTGKANALAHQDRTRSPSVADVRSQPVLPIATVLRPSRTVNASAHSDSLSSTTELVANHRTSIIACQARPSPTDNALAQLARPS